MIISAIVAQANDRVIGHDNKLPWHLPADLAHFKKLTMNNSILMGRRTFDSIGRALPQRKNIVLTQNHTFSAKDCVIVHSVESALREATQGDLYVIGGAEVFKLFWPQISRIYLTQIHHEFAGDTFFPEIDRSQWQEVSREDHEPDEKNNYAYSFITLRRKLR